jgi:His-Xaa-Ser system protein HxsD
MDKIKMDKTAMNYGCVLKINPGIYSLRVIYSCAHVFLDSAYIFLDGNPKKEILVRIEAKNGKNSKRIAGEFLNELLNASLRYQISQENRKIREAIVGSALLSVSENRRMESDGCGCREDLNKNRHAALNWGQVQHNRNHKDSVKAGKKIKDPLGISMLWEDKYGKDNKSKL